MKQIADALTKGGHPELTLIQLIARMGMVMASPLQAEGQIDCTN